MFTYDGNQHNMSIRGLLRNHDKTQFARMLCIYSEVLCRSVFEKAWSNKEVEPLEVQKQHLNALVRIMQETMLFQAFIVTNDAIGEKPADRTHALQVLHHLAKLADGIISTAQKDNENMNEASCRVYLAIFRAFCYMQLEEVMHAYAVEQYAAHCLNYRKEMLDRQKTDTPFVGSPAILPSEAIEEVLQTEMPLAQRQATLAMADDNWHHAFIADYFPRD